MTRVPGHIAIIMDGNRRWARAHRLPDFAGHKKVVDEILEPLIERAADRGVKFLTFWAWSTENWERTPVEVRGIMTLFRHTIEKSWQRLHRKGVRIKIIGDITKFPRDIQKTLGQVVKQTEGNIRITVVFGLNYGGRDEIRRAIVRLHGISNFNPPSGGQISKITEEKFSKFLDTKDIPDPELIIRTGGEERLSGFLLWQCQYSELLFPKFFMPDFTPEKLDECISVYQKRRRRFGK
jgi:undecaprenyl diphosphate synthase